MGSMLIGDKDDILRARRVRKLFGGSMRQVGIVAAAAIYALEKNIDRLQDDHNNAKTLAQGLAEIDGVHCDPTAVESNLVFFEIDSQLGTAVQMSSTSKEQGVLIGPMGGQRLRAVTHLDVDAADIVRTLDVVRDCVNRGFAEASATGSGPYGR